MKCTLTATTAKTTTTLLKGEDISTWKSFSDKQERRMIIIIKNEIYQRAGVKGCYNDREGRKAGKEPLTAKYT